MLPVRKHFIFVQETCTGVYLSKKCSRCKKVKLISSFSPHSSSRPYNLDSRCKKCNAERAAARRLTQPEQHLAIKKRYRTNNAEKHLQATKDWVKKNPKRKQLLNKRRRLKKQELYVEDIDSLTVFERDRWICQLCGNVVDSTLRWPHVMSATVDHVIPLSRGGKHSYANVQLAHFRCNCSKNNKLVE